MPSFPKILGAIKAAGRSEPALDMSAEARQLRAKQLGFGTQKLYHGTNKDFDAFSLEGGGRVSGSPVGKLGVSLSPDPEVASEFANLAGSEGANVIPAVARSAKRGLIELDGSETNLEVAAAVRGAFDQGFDAIKLTNYTTPGGQTGKSMVLVKDPSQIRSVNAAFDPAKKASSNLLAGGSGAAVGLGIAGALSGRNADAADIPADREQLQQQLDLYNRAGPAANLKMSAINAFDAVGRPIFRGLTDLVDGVSYFPRAAASIPIGAINALAGRNIALPIDQNLRPAILDPRTDAERLSSSVSNGLGGVLGGFGAGGSLSRAPGAIGAIGRQLLARPAAQTAAAVTGPAAASLAQKTGAGGKLQVASGFLGSILPFLRGIR